MRARNALAMVVALAATLLLAVSGSARAQAASGGALLPAGYLHTRGSQVVGADGLPVRIAAVGWFGQNGLDQNTPVGVDGPYQGIDANVQAMRAAGFNTVTIGWNDASLHDADASAYLAGIDAVVGAARHAGLRVILNHHNDEGQEGNGNCLAQQANGLWYDSGPGTNGTDGCGTAGTVTQATFQSDWERLARHYAGNPTVVGFDLDNEPLAYPGMSTWGDGGTTDIRRMYDAVGSALEAIDPGVLVICEGPQNYNGTFAGPAGVTSPEGDLTAVTAQPVVLTVGGHQVRDQVVYSVHEYPNEISGVAEDSGAAAVARYNGDWGYLVRDSIAPVWVGEAGSSMLNNPDDANWAATLTAYVDGRDGAAGGPVFPGVDQGVSTTWWAWGYLPGEYPDGTLNSDGSLEQAQYAVYSKWEMRPLPGAEG